MLRFTFLCTVLVTGSTTQLVVNMHYIGVIHHEGKFYKQIILQDKIYRFLLCVTPLHKRIFLYGWLGKQQ